MYKLNRYLVLAVAALLACACVFASAQDQDAPADTESNSDSTMDASSDADWDVDSNFADTPSLATTGPATTQGASTQPTTLPSRPLIQAKADDLFANALFGSWNNDIGIGNIHLSLRPDYRFRLSRVVGTFRVHGNSIVLRTQGGQATYQFRFDGKLLVLSGGDLRQEIRFTRQSNVNDSLSSLFEVSSGTMKRKGMRILLAISIMIAARLFVGLLRGVSFLMINSTRGPLAAFYRSNKARTRTVHSLMLNAAKYVVYFTALGFILGEVGVNYTAYLASLSVIGLAIGFGSQGLVQDTVTGFFIILENQFDVGDMVEISGQTGIVLEFGLRTTTILNYLGQAIVIPNRNITQVGRYRLNSQLAMVDVRVANAQAVEPTKALLSKIGHELNAQFPGVMKEDPQIQEPVKLATGEVFVRLVVLFWPGQTWIVDAQLVPRIKAGMKAQNIENPADQVVLCFHAHNEEETIDWRDYLHLRKKPETTAAK